MTRRTDPLILGACFTANTRRPDFERLKALARSAERGTFAALSFNEPPEQFEALTLMSALAAVTERIGLIASPNDPEPYHIARKLASFDHLSNGRAAWGVASEPSSQRAIERHDLVNDLWDSWDDDAFIRDKARGRYFDPGKLHTLNHKGEHFSVRGPLNVARPPQGHPLRVHTLASEADTALAIRVADVIIAEYRDLPAAQAFYHDIKQRAAALGRNPEHLKILTTINPLGSTPNDIAERFEHGFQTRACDGFNVLFTDSTDAIDTFVEHVIPLLQHRGLLRHGYSGSTLREHLGLPRPSNRFSASVHSVTEPAHAP
ncbi:LLM class flavin-dependent oxidoreductase [Pseudomonas helleri]|uniref:LLM class flavin-dependent oxidoreductase n=1 Tax=Pseudomonas helleri TaxID=1608996 RepID=UPI00389A15B7